MNTAWHIVLGKYEKRERQRQREGWEERERRGRKVEREGCGVPSLNNDCCASTPPNLGLG